MYYIEVPDTINRLIGVYYLLGFWNKDRTTFLKNGIQIFHCTYFVLFVISIGMGAWIADDKNGSILSTVICIQFTVHAYRMYCIFLNQKEIIVLIHEVGKQFTNDHNEFMQVSNKLKIIIKIVNYFTLMLICANVFIAAVPFLSSEKQLAYYIGIPLDWKNSGTEFWLTHAYIVVGSSIGTLYGIFTLIIWYLMVNCAIKYEMLGNQLRSVSVIGSIETMEKSKVSATYQQKVLVQQLIVAIRRYETTNKTVDQFASCFDNLLFVQISTSSIIICGSIYSMVFSSHGNVFQLGFDSIFIAYSLFDTFMLMYLANEINVYSDRLSYCLYESSWIEQSQSYKKYIIILAEVLKQSKRLIIGKLYALDLNTFTSIVKGAYSYFNLLKNSS